LKRRASLRQYTGAANIPFVSAFLVIPVFQSCSGFPVVPAIKAFQLFLHSGYFLVVPVPKNKRM
jgi:hypothetical protein